jgi:hypothetical protein
MGVQLAPGVPNTIELPGEDSGQKDAATRDESEHGKSEAGKGSVVQAGC